jgi:hypothetical protein
MNKKKEEKWRLVPRVRYVSEAALRRLCEELLRAYSHLVQRLVSERFRARGLNALAWSELDRLMLGIASFEELMDEGMCLVLASTCGNGALYAHELNSRVTQCINKHNSIFFHGTTSVSEWELQAGLAEMLARVLLTSSHSHYHSLLGANFRGLVAWDGDEWLLCPKHRVWEYKAAVLEADVGKVLPEDLLRVVLELLGFDETYPERRPAGTCTRWTLVRAILTCP